MSSRYANNRIAQAVANYSRVVDEVFGSMSDPSATIETTKGDQKMILQELTQEERVANARTHIIGELPADECFRCIRCEIGAWNAWKERCSG